MRNLAIRMFLYIVVQSFDYFKEYVVCIYTYRREWHVYKYMSLYVFISVLYIERAREIMAVNLVVFFFFTV